MVQLPTVSGADTRDAFVATPLDDNVLPDFGGGRKLPLKVSDIYRRLTA